MKDMKIYGLKMKVYNDFISDISNFHAISNSLFNLTLLLFHSYISNIAMHSKQRKVQLSLKNQDNGRTHTCSKFDKLKNYEQTDKFIRMGKYIVHLDEVLGNGYSSKVYKGTEEGKRNLVRYAVKVIELKHFSQSNIQMFEREIEIHRSLRHDHIIRCYEAYKTKTHIYMVMEYCPHGDLADFIMQKKKLSQTIMVDVMTQILSGYKYLAREGIIHRDLKPANIMRSGKIWKIADFGFAIKSQAFTDDVNVGTPFYMPLQALAGNYYSVKSDIYALGIILYEMLHGKPPWTCKSQKQLVRRISRQRVVISQQVNNKKIKEFILKCCNNDEEKRMSREQLEAFDFNNDNCASSQPSNSQTESDKLFIHSSCYTAKETDMDTAYIENNSQILRSELKHCHFVYNMSKNIQHFHLSAEQKNIFLMVLLEYLLKLIKMMQDDAFSSQRLIKFDQYKTTDTFHLLFREIKEDAAKYEKVYLVFIRNTDVKTIRAVNQKFKEFTVSGTPLSNQFYRNFWIYLVPIVKNTSSSLYKILSDVGQPEDSSLPQKLQSFQNLMILQNNPSQSEGIINKHGLRYVNKPFQEKNDQNRLSQPTQRSKLPLTRNNLCAPDLIPSSIRFQFVSNKGWKGESCGGQGC